MADALKRDLIEVEQTLHGYSEGHRLIAASLKLSQAEARTMLVLSDASGGGARIPAGGYITGYPLAGVGKYVLARTWGAPEMSRPGCVWTHSLLVDFADLARMASADDLVERFVRPTGDAASNFGETLYISLRSSPAELDGFVAGRLGQWLAALYDHPKSRVAAEREGSGDDALVLAVWMQQWPRLRRAFRFCTQVAEDRSVGADIFDLQLIEGGRANFRSHASNAVFPSNGTLSARLDPLVDDILYPGRTQLRSFLRGVGSDVSEGRGAMLPLVGLFEALDLESGSRRLADAVIELESLGPNQAGRGRAVATRLVFSRPEAVDDHLASFALNQVGLSTDLLDIDPAVVGRALLKWRPRDFGHALTREGPLRTAVQAVLPTIGADDLASRLSEHPNALSDLLPARPDLFSSPILWRVSGLNASALLKAAVLDENQITEVVGAMLEAGRDDSVGAVVGRFGARPLLRALAERAASGVPNMWLRVVASHTDDVASCMADGTLRDRRMLLALAKVMDPDAVPNSVGEDPWVTALGNSVPSGDGSGEDMLAALLFCRALGWTSMSQGRLFFLSVQRLHEASAVNRLRGAARSMTERRLPWVMPWREWDRCERIRNAVVDHFVDRELPPLEFGTVVDDDKLWTRLVDVAAESGRGRRYLDRVRRKLEKRAEEGLQRRARDIDRRI